MAKFTRGEIRKILGDAHTEEIENQLIALHLGVLDPLKDDLQKAQAAAEKAVELQKQVDDIKNGKDWKAEHDKVKKMLDDLQTSTAAKETEAKVKAALRAMLKEESIDPSRYDLIERHTNYAGLKLDAEGKLENADQLRKDINDDWGVFKVKESTRGTATKTPPDGGKVTRTKEEIMAIRDTAERQQAIAENHELFGF